MREKLIISFHVFCRQSQQQSVSRSCISWAQKSPDLSLFFPSPLSLSLFLLHTRGTTNKLDQTDSRWVVRVVWIRALLRTDSNLRSWVDFSLGHQQIYLAAAVVARLASLSSFSLQPQQQRRSLLIDTSRMGKNFYALLCSFVVHQHWHYARKSFSSFKIKYCDT